MIEVTRTHEMTPDNLMHRELWWFVILNSNSFPLLCLDSYAKQNKTTRQRNWRVDERYDSYDHRRFQNKPVIPADVAAEAKQQLKDAIDKQEITI